MSSETALEVRSDQSAHRKMGKWDPAIDLTGASLGAVASVMVGQSLDTVKVKMQTFPHLYRSAPDCFMQTFRKDGVRGLYAGTVPSLVANVAENAVLFVAYGLCKKAVMYGVGKTHENQLTTFENATSGFFAAFFAAGVLTPTELIKCRLQAMRETRDVALRAKPLLAAEPLLGPFALTKSILRSEGVKGMFRGFQATCMREMPGYFCYFGAYEATRHFLTPLGKTKDDLSPFRIMIAGGVGGASLWIAIFPADVIKSRNQVSEGGKVPGFFSSLVKIYRHEGIRALYKGLGPTVARTIPATGSLFVVYEWCKSHLSRLAYGHDE